MASITSWTRLEPRARQEEMGTALQARVWDPLWLLARQWQVGELTAENAGSPVAARIDAECAQPTRYMAGTLLGGTADRSRARDFNTCVLPLETLVERERLHEDAPASVEQRYENPRSNLRVAAEAGLHFLRLLAAKDMAEQYRNKYVDTFPLRAPAAAEVSRFDADTQRWFAVVADRVVDGTLLYASLAPLYNTATGTLGDLPREPSIDPTHRDAVTSVAEAWLRWYSALLSELPAGEQASWNAERMEYQFAIAAPLPASGGAELVLEASEYVDGRLDWFAFNARPGTALGATAVVPSNPALLTRTFIPTPIRYPGMPSNGWFEMEDAQVNFGAVDAAPEDLARLLLVDFALVYSDDWFVIPVELEVGSLCRVRSLVITDSFGATTAVPHYAAVDAQPSGWRMFCVAAGNSLGADTAAGDVFFLPPTLDGVIESRPAEEVLLLRDEIANMAWAVERVVESASGRPLDRFQLAQERRRREQDDPARETPAPLAPFVYRLASDVPENWIPLVPQRVNAGDRPISIRLRSNGAPSTLRGRVIDPKGVSLFDETVPRAGARVTRTYQLARWIDGSTHLWSGRRTGVGQGEGSSGLRFDLVEPRK